MEPESSSFLAQLAHASKIAKAQQEVERSILFKPTEYEGTKNLAPKFTNIDTFLEFYRWFINAFIAFRVFTPLLASNCLVLPFNDSSTMADFKKRIDFEKSLLTKLDDARFRQAQASDPNSQLSHNIAPSDYIRVAVHKLIPGCALPDVSIDMHLLACKPSSAYLGMTHEVIVRHAKVCYNHVRIHQAEY